MISLGTTGNGRRLAYDPVLYEFRLEREQLGYAELQALDRRGCVRWAAPEQRDWFRRLDAAQLERCNRRALQLHGSGQAALTPEEQVLADARRDDSVLAGKIVEADPALVHAVALSLEEQGLLGGQGQQPVIGMLQGMEALSQLQKQPGRKMTVMEHFLMRQILKNEDKEKARQQKAQESQEEAAVKEEAAAKEELEKRGKIDAAQRRMEKKEAREEAALRRRSANADGTPKGKAARYS